MKLTQCAILTSTFAILATAGTETTPTARLTMTVRVLDQAHVSGGTIHKMEKYIAETFAAADVDVKWIDCAADVEACKAPRGANEFWMRILAGIPAGVEAEQLGFAQPGEGGGIRCVNAIYPRVRELVEHARVDMDQMLGAALAHEIGHLYLGHNDRAHSKTGIMTGVWSMREIELANLGELRFTPEQAKRIQAAMTVNANVGDRR
jgi:hypothetical protein